MTPNTPRILKPRQNIGRPPARRQPDHKIPGRKIILLQVFSPHVPAVLGSLDRLCKSLLAPGDQPDHRLRTHAKSRRTLRSIQHTQTPAGPGSHIKDPASLLQTLNSPLGSLGNLLEMPAHLPRDFFIFLVHHRHDLQRRHYIKIHSVWISGFCGHDFAPCVG